jgi:putative inorganic carbon (HCO3(-)) transporter
LKKLKQNVKSISLLRKIDQLHWLWLILAAPFLLFPSPTRSLAMLVVPGLFLIHWLADRGERKSAPPDRPGSRERRAPIIAVTPLNAALLLLALMILASLWVTFDITYSLPKIAGLVLGMGVFFAIVRESRSNRGWLLSLLAFLCTGTGIGVAGLLGTAWFKTAKLPLLTPLIDRLPRVISGLQGAESGFHPNEVAGALAWVMPIMMALSLAMALMLFKKEDNPLPASKANKARRGGSGKNNRWDLILTLMCLVATAFTGVVFLLTQSRGGYIGLGLALLILLFLALSPKWRRYGGVTLIILVVVTGVILFSNREGARSWITGTDLASEATFSVATLQQRLEIWARAVQGIHDFPFTGMGLNGFRKVVPVLYPLFNFPADFDIGHAHNELLQAALDLGIPGLVAFISLYLGAFWMLVETWIKSHKAADAGQTANRLGLPSQGLLNAILLGLGGGLLAHMLYGFTDAVALGAKPGLLYWMLLALICGLYLRVNADQEKPRARSD